MTPICVIAGLVVSMVGESVSRAGCCLAIQLGIAAQVDDAHTAPAELALDRKRTEATTWAR
jgi:hypothetical protein